MTITKPCKDMVSPILLYGESHLSKDIILRAKKKYDDAQWITLPAKEDSDTDTIRAEMGGLGWDDTCKILVVNNLANRKNMREFLLKIAKDESDVKLIIWDSTNVIKVNPKTDAVDTAAWKPFVKEFETLGKVVNSGAVLTIKETSNCVDFVKNRFKREGRVIDSGAANLLIKLVGLDKGMLSSEISKLCVIAPENVTYPFILDNSFTSSKEAVLYVFSNALDKDTVEDCLCLVEEFMHNGINENVIAEILMNKARWQLVVADLFAKGQEWDDIAKHMMKMGTFPSDGSAKQESLSGAIEYLCNNMGMSKKYFTHIIKISDSKAKMKRGAILPMPFMAYDIVKFVRINILRPHISDMKRDEAKEFLLSRALKVYGSIHKRLCNIRMQQSVMGNLNAMVMELKDPDCH